MKAVIATTLGVIFSAGFCVASGAAQTLNTTERVAASTKTIKACYDKKTKDLRYLGANQSCKATERLLTWYAVGPQGVAGPAGPAGSAGPAGPAGPAGAAGDTGDQGPAGPAGPEGPAGAPGAPGAKGDTGAAGAKGDTGAAGAKGDTGAQGSIGLTGPVGPAGSITVQDDGNQTLGVLLSETYGTVTIYIPSLNKTAQILTKTDPTYAGKLWDLVVYYETDNCTGTLYSDTNHNLLSVFENVFYTTSTLTHVTIASNRLQYGACTPLAPSERNMYQLQAVLPEDIPFTLPVALPLKYDHTN
jgi:hypothetical protein